MRFSFWRRDNSRRAPGPVRAAEGLARSGRFREAIALLTEENRKHRRADIEQRLVELRHEGYLALEHPRGLPTWPPESADVFGPHEGLVEVSRERFSLETLRAGILHHGSLIVRGFLDPAKVELLRSDIEMAVRGRDAAGSGAPVSETTPWFVQMEPMSGHGFEKRDQSEFSFFGGVAAADSPRALFDVLDCMDSTGIGDLVTRYLGERPALSLRKTTLRNVRPDIKADLGWHQDGAFLGAGTRTVNMWIALSPCGVDAPSMDIVARRLNQIVPTGTDGAAFDWSVSQAMVEKFREGSAIVRPTFAPGDAIFLDQMTLHRTGAGPEMTRYRLALEAWFFAPSTFPMKQVPILY